MWSSYILVALIAVAMSVRIIKQYVCVVVFDLGKDKGKARGPGLIFIVPFVDRVRRDQNSTVVVPAPLMSTIAELGSFMERESNAARRVFGRPGPPERVDEWSARGLMTATCETDRPRTVHARLRPTGLLDFRMGWRVAAARRSPWR
jgi:hypothetical protein